MTLRAIYLIRKPRALLVATIAVLAGCQTLPGPAETDPQPRQWQTVRARVKLQLATQQCEGGLFEDAAATVSESIALDPTLPAGYALLAKANLEQGRLASARRALDAAAQAGVESAELHYLRGVILEQHDRPDEALVAFERAGELDPTRVDYAVAVAETLVALDRPADALAVVERAGAHVDDAATLAALAAQIELLLGNREDAVSKLRAAIRAGGESPTVREDLARLLVEVGRCGEALAVLRPMLESGADPALHPVIHRYAGACHLASGDVHQARYHLDVYARHRPDDAQGQLLLAKAALAGGDTVTALAAVDRVERHLPNHPEVWLVRAALAWARGHASKAAADLYDLIENRPGDVDAHCLLAEVLRSRDRNEAARRYFRKALELDPECTWAQAGIRAIERGETVRPERSSPAVTGEFGAMHDD